MNLRFNSKFFIPFILLLIIEILIAVFVDDYFIRPFVGDVLVVMLIYFFVRMTTELKHLHAIIGVLLFSFFIEFTQYFKLIELLKLENNKLAKTIIGSKYDAWDFVAYSIGALIIIFIAFILKLIRNNKTRIIVN